MNKNPFHINVHDLHERGGATDIIHMHGELRKIRCQACGAVEVWQEDCGAGTRCCTCNSLGRMRPHIVWFGEMPFRMDEIYDRLAECDLFVSVGTSGNVYPAAGFVAEVRAHGHAHTIEINLEPSNGASFFAECRHGRAGDLLPLLVDELLQEGKAP